MFTLFTDGSYQYLDGFRLKLSSPDLVYVINMTVNVTQQPIDETSKVLTARCYCYCYASSLSNWAYMKLTKPQQT